MYAVHLCVLTLLLPLACAKASDNEDGGDTDPTGSSTAPETSLGPQTGADPETATTPGGVDSGAESGAESGADGTTGDPDPADSSGSGGPIPTSIYSEAFEGPDGAMWPAPWTAAGTAILDSALDGGRGRMAGATTTVGRMVLPGFNETDVDATVVVSFGAAPQQGFGFYVRQNGGALQQTPTPGQGYAVYVEGDGQAAIGVWRELGGVEELMLETSDPLAGGLASDTPYRIRLQCAQSGAQTTLRVKIWRDGESQPAAWQIEHSDASPALQNTAGSFAVDIYNYAGTGSVYVDAIEISAL